MCVLYVCVNIYVNVCRKKYKTTHFYFLGLPPRDHQLNPLGLPLCEALGVRVHTQHAQRVGVAL